MTTRLALNVHQSGRRRRETSVDFWSFETVDQAADDPATRAERREAVDQALLIIVGRLTPRERAAYLLREAFDYPYIRISELLHLGVASTRQLVCRARLRVATDGRSGGSTASQQRFLQTFLGAARAGDLVGLEEFLAAANSPT